jgi:predicted ribosomally synthesized peptide with nif11-like leader
MMLDEVQSRDELLRVAKSAGYSFTQAELKNALVALMELSESDLARVSGGVAAITLCRELFMIRNYCES